MNDPTRTAVENDRKEEGERRSIRAARRGALADKGERSDWMVDAGMVAFRSLSARRPDMEVAVTKDDAEVLQEDVNGMASLNVEIRLTPLLDDPKRTLDVACLVACSVTSVAIVGSRPPEDPLATDAILNERLRTSRWYLVVAPSQQEESIKCQTGECGCEGDVEALEEERWPPKVAYDDRSIAGESHASGIF